MISQNPSSLPAVQVGQLLEKIYDYIREADRYGQGVLWPGPDDKEYRIEKAIATDNLLSAWRCILTLLEIGGHHFLFEEAKKDLDECRKSPLKYAMGLEEPYLVWVGEAREYLGYIQAIHAPSDPKSISQQQASLLPLLRRCEKYVVSPKLFAWPPCDEPDIHVRIEELLSCYYSDLRSKPRISKPVKHFEPDTVLPFIKSVVEYKFVNSAEDAKRILDEILADIGGYQSTDNRLIVFAIYETDRFVREEEWQAAIRASKPSNPFEVIVLKGVRFQPNDEQRMKQHREVIKKHLAKRKQTKASQRRTPAGSRAKQS